MSTAAPAHPGYGSKRYRAYALGVLLVVYTFNFIDRILVGVSARIDPRDLGMSELHSDCSAAVLRLYV